LDIKTKVKQKLPPFVEGEKQNGRFGRRRNEGARRIKEGQRSEEEGANGEADGCEEARARFPMTEDDNNRSSVFFHFALLSYY